MLLAARAVLIVVATVLSVVFLAGREFLAASIIITAILFNMAVSAWMHRVHRRDVADMIGGFERLLSDAND